MQAAVSTRVPVVEPLTTDGIRMRTTIVAWAVAAVIGAFFLYASLDVRPSLAILPAASFAAAFIIGWARVATRLSWRSMLAVAIVATIVWTIVLSASDGWRALAAPLTTRSEYLHDVGSIGSPHTFLEGFVRNLPHYSTHVRGHPPLMILILWTLARIGLGSAGWLAALCIAGGALAGTAALVAMREVAGERAARAAAPFLILSPAALFVATSVDAFFAGVAGVSVALIVLATGRSGRRANVLAAAGGFMFGATALLSYGLVPVAILPIAVAWTRRRGRPLAIAALGATAVVIAFGAGGFWWPAGLQATMHEYARGIASTRPYALWLFADIAVLALAAGPGLTGFAFFRDRRALILPAAGVAAILIADLSGRSKAEVERIWLPFVPWILLSASALPARYRRPVLAVGAVTALSIQVIMRTVW